MLFRSQKQRRHHHSGIDAYGATAPAEFFAVVSEYFFTHPLILRQQAPAVYEQLVLFYHQTPEKRQTEFD